MPPTRLITLDDASMLADTLSANRDFLAPWEPLRDDAYATPRGQRTVIRAALEQCEQGTTLPRVILDETGRVVGRITLNGIVRGAFQSCSVGFWLSADTTGHGLATAALRDVIQIAFQELGLHRVQAECLLHNVRSQRVLDRAGFVRFGVAPTYLKIAGQWQDCAIYQLVSPGPS